MSRPPQSQTHSSSNIIMSSANQSTIPFPRLPPEILANICNLSQFQDLRNLRLADRTFADLAAKHLFEEVYLILLPESIKKIQNIARTPALNKHVKSMFYFGDRFDVDMEHFQRWRRHTSNGEPYKQADYSKFQRFCAISKVHDKLIKRGEEVKFLAWAMRRFERLELSALTCFSGFSEWNNCTQYSIFDKLSCETKLPAHKMLCNHAGDTNMLSFALPNFLQAISLCGRAIDQVVLDMDCSDVWSDTFCPAFFPAMKPFATIALSKVTHLDVSFDIIDVNPSTLARIIKFLVLASNVQLLKLWFRWDGADLVQTEGMFQPLDLRVDITPLLSKLRFGHLNELYLQNVSVQTDTFIDFMEEHASTFLSLTISNMELYDNSTYVRPS